MKTASVARLTHESSFPEVFASQAGVKRSEVHSRPQSPSFLCHVVGKRGAATGRLQIKPSGFGTRMSEARHELKKPARTSQIPPAPFARYGNGELLAKE